MAVLSADGTKILNNYDSFTGELFNATVYQALPSGVVVDNAVWFKNKTSLGGGFAKRDFTGSVNVKWYGAKGDNTTNDAPLIQKALDLLKSSGGGSLFFPAGDYFLSVADENFGCLSVDFGNISIYGEGYASNLVTKNNAHTHIHVCAERNLTIAPSGTMPENVEIYGVRLTGTGNYQYFGLAKGRGILMRKVVNVSIHDNWVNGLSMIGIVIERGNGYFRCNDNRVKDCKYSAINYNGRCYQSTINGNIISGTNGDINSCAIQADGHCMITSNTIFGDLTNPQLAGGIIWGEGNYDGVGIISGNIIKHVRYGIRAVYHGSINIANNLIINVSTIAGISLTGTTHPSFTVANSDNDVCGNTMINCVLGVDCSSANTVFTSNKIRNIANPVNSSALTEPDAILPQVTNVGIRIRSSGCSLIGNDVSGAVRGLTTTIAQENGVMVGNKLSNNNVPYSVEGISSYTYAIPESFPVSTRSNSGTTFKEEIFSGQRPIKGYFPLSSEWKPSVPGLIAKTGSIVVYTGRAITTATAATGALVISLDNVDSMSTADPTGTVFGIELDNGTWHWTTAQSKSGNDVTIGVAIPVGRTVNVGANVLYNFWADLAKLTSDGKWNGSHLVMGVFHIWIDAAGAIRKKGSVPTSDTDGSVIVENTVTYSATELLQGLVKKAAAVTGTSPTTITKTAPATMAAAYSQVEVQQMNTDILNLTTQLNRVVTQLNSLRINMQTAGQLST